MYIILLGSLPRSSIGKAKENEKKFVSLPYGVCQAAGSVGGKFLAGNWLRRRFLEMRPKSDGGKRCLKKSNICKWLIMRLRSVKYFFYTRHWRLFPFFVLH
jgi:hypothetical protein